jgi:hypothetical protein
MLIVFTQQNANFKNNRTPAIKPHSLSLAREIECISHFRPKVEKNHSSKQGVNVGPSIGYLKKKLNSVAFSPEANYTDRATAACRRS